MFKSTITLLLGLALAGGARAADEGFEVGKNWFAVEPPQPTASADKVAVVEVFSYACPACNAFQPTMSKLKAALPANAELSYLPASFNPSEDWPMFQRAFFTAQALGIVDKAHEALFDAVWKNDGALRITDPATHRLVKPLPTIEDIATFYGKFGVTKDDALGVAHSFAVNTRMKSADAMVKTLGVDSTPTLIVNGKYRLTAASAGSVDKVVPLVLFLISRDTAGK